MEFKLASPLHATMSTVSALTFAEARASVRHQLQAIPPPAQIESVPILQTNLRVLAEDILADRDYPPLARSLRDGYAVQASDLPGELTITGEVRAGESAEQSVAALEAIEIMTGAPIPPGADAVLMIEHAQRQGDRIVTERRLEAGAHILRQAAECSKGDLLLNSGTFIGYAEAAVLAMAGYADVKVYSRPRVAILSTGDEVISVDRSPLPYQVRNSNAYALALLVQQAGGIPMILPIAPDRYDELRTFLERGLEYDMLLLSGGVSAGKYDMVEKALSDLEAEFYFDRVLIQPGQPVVFGRARGKFFFGLPGNPASTIVTFRLFARSALLRLAGVPEPVLPLLYAHLTRPFSHKPGLTRFLPAMLDAEGMMLTPLSWQGSSDVTAVARANAFLVADSERESWATGDEIRILMK